MWSFWMLMAFLVLMVSIGLWGMRKTQTVNDFLLGGRAIGPWVSALAYGTTYFSAVLFIGFAGKLGWGFGLNALWIAAGNTLFGALLAWLVLGRRTRTMTQNLDVMTMPEFFHRRYGDVRLKLFAAIITFLFLLPYCASVFKGLGHLFEKSFGMSYDLALCIMILITGLYLILGGYFAVTMTDFIQGLIMLGGCAALVGTLVGNAGGLDAITEQLPVRYAAHVPPAKFPGWLMLASLVFMTSFGTWGLPQMVQKFYAIKNEGVIRKAAVATTLFSLVIVFTAYFTGSLSHLFFDPPTPAAAVATAAEPAPGVAPAALPDASAASPTRPLPMRVLPNGKPQVDFDRVIPDLLTWQLPPALMGLILLLVLSASMSTLSSLVLVASSAVAVDVYQGMVNPRVSPRRSLLILRALNGLFILVALLIARRDFHIIVTLMSLSWGAVAGAFTAPYVLGLFSRRVTAAGAWAGMLAGLATAIVPFFALERGRDLAPVFASAAILVPFVVVPLISAFTKPPAGEALDQAFRGV